MSLLLHLLAPLFALFLSIKHLPNYRLNTRETIRFLIKSINLAVCYVGFSRRKTLVEAYRSGLAAYICSGYDVVTDWKKYEVEYFENFIASLGKMLDSHLLDVGVSLYEKETSRKLKDDGLERGFIAFDFIIELLDLKDVYEKEVDLYEVGKFCQIVDDILDFEKDTLRNETNCLASPNKDKYLQFFSQKMREWDFNKLFPVGFALKYAFKKAAKKVHDFEFLTIEYNSEIIHQSKYI